MRQLVIANFLLIATDILFGFVNGAAMESSLQVYSPISKLTKRDAKHESHTNMFHNHLSRKVFDRACAASKDTIDEIIECLTSNQNLVKMVKPEKASSCFKNSFGVDFDPKDFHKHKELICNNREKFEEMTSCVYRRTVEASDPKEVEKLTESMVDVGLCIINALDG